jgi:hypothetical protein
MKQQKKSSLKLLEWGKMEVCWEDGNGGDDDDKDDPLSDEQYGYPKTETDWWVSYIRVLGQRSATTTFLVELQTM